MEKLSLFARLKGAASNFWNLNRSTYPTYYGPQSNQYADRGITLTDEAKVRTDQGYIKAFVSNDFLYKPPYGYPRYLDIPTIRALAKSPYVWQCTSTIIDEIGAIDWDIVPIKRDEPDKDESDSDIEEDYSAPKVDIAQVKRIKEVKEFFNNPNGNDESFNFLIRAAVRDILEIDSGVWVKVFNRAGKMVQLFARDGGTFLKNPDIHGYLANRAAYVPMPGQFQDDESKKEFYANTVVQSAAYFQYGWVAMMPIPFGTREIVYMMRNSRSDSIYGRSPVEVLQDVLQTLIYGATFNLDYFINNNMPDGVIQLIGANQEQMNAFRERFEQQFKKQDSWGNWRKIFHKFPISNSEVKFTPFALKPQEMAIIEQQTWFSKLVWSCFGVTPSELGYTESSNRATEMVQSKVFKRKAIRPLLRVLEYHINTQLIPEFGYDDIEFKFNDYDVEEDLERHKLFEIQLRNSIKTINEVREEIGMHPVEGGDKIAGGQEEEFGWDNPEAGSDRFGGGKRDQFGEEEEGDIREAFDMEDKSIDMKAKYIKRTGTSGKYKYWYRNPKTGKLESGKKKVVKKKDDAQQYATAKYKELKPADKKVIEGNVKTFLAGQDTKGVNYNGKFWTKERRVFHSKVLEDYTAKAAQAVTQGKRPKVIFMAGLPASGKTYATQKFYDKVPGSDGKLIQDKDGEKYLVLNADDVKGYLPEYDNGRGATLVHNESSHLVGNMIKSFAKLNVNIVVDGTLAKTDKALDQLRLFKKKGYKTNITYVTVPAKTAIDRAANRYKEEGRFVPYGLIPDYEDKIEKTMHFIKDSVDTFRHIDNTGVKPKIIAESGV